MSKTENPVYNQNIRLLTLVNLSILETVMCVQHKITIQKVIMHKYTTTTQDYCLHDYCLT